MVTLQKFKDAQSGGEFEQALAEIQAGHKTGHWIWYIFPQLAGLGQSSMAREFGIRDVAEASDYITDPVLGPRLLTIAQAVRDQLNGGEQVSRLLGSHVDALKLVSSMTLFGEVARRLVVAGQSGTVAKLEDVAAEILSTAERQGYRRCTFTRTVLASS